MASYSHPENTNREKVYSWIVPRAAIKLDVEDDGSPTMHVPVADVRQLVGVVGLSAVRQIDPGATISTARYPSGFYDASDRPPEQITPLVLQVRPDMISLSRDKPQII